MNHFYPFQFWFLLTVAHCALFEWTLHPAAKGVQQKVFGKKVTKKWQKSQKRWHWRSETGRPSCRGPSSTRQRQDMNIGEVLPLPSAYLYVDNFETSTIKPCKVSFSGKRKCPKFGTIFVINHLFFPCFFFLLFLAVFSIFAPFGKGLAILVYCFSYRCRAQLGLWQLGLPVPKLIADCNPRCCPDPAQQETRETHTHIRTKRQKPSGHLRVP